MSPRFKLLCVLMMSLPACSAVFAQTAKEIAEETAAIEKAKADALEDQLRARKAQLSLDQADKIAAQEADAKEQELADKRQTALATASKSLSDMSLKGAITDVSVSGVAIETSALTYRTLLPLTDRIVAEIKDIVPVRCKGVLLADEALLSSFPAYQMAENSLKTLSQQYKTAINKAQNDFVRLKGTAESGTKAGPATIPLVVNGIAALASVAQAFKTQMSVVSSAITIDPLALQAALAHSWRSVPKNRQALVVYPGFVDGAAASDVGAAVNELAANHDRAIDLQSDMTTWLNNRAVQDAADAAMQKAAKGAAKKKPATDPVALQKKQAVEGIAALLAQLKTIDTRVTQVIDTLNATSEQHPVSPLTQLIKIGFSIKKLRDGVPALTIKVVASGGNSLATNNLFTGAKLFHSGGAVLAYSLLDSDGAVLAGNVLDSHTGYVRMPRNTVPGLGNSWQQPAPPTDSMQGVTANP